MASKQHNLEWIIDGERLKRFKNAKFKEMEFGPYIFIGSVLFYLNINPNGYSNENSFQIFLYCDASFHDISKLKVKYTIKVNEINYKWNDTKMFTNFPDNWGIPNDAIKRDSVCNLDRITIQLSFTILNIYDKNDSNIHTNLWNKYLNINNDILSNINRLEWKLNNTELNQLKQCKFKDKIISQTMYANDIPLYIYLYPKGSQTENNVGIFLYCDVNKLNIAKMDAFFRVYIDHIQFSLLYMYTFTMETDNAGIASCTLKSDDIINMDKLTIQVELKIYKIVTRNASKIPTNIWKQKLSNDDEKKSDTDHGIFNIFRTTSSRNDSDNMDHGIIKKINQEFDLMKMDNISLKTSVNKLKQEITSLKDVLNIKDQRINSLQNEQKSMVKQYNILKNDMDSKNRIIMKKQTEIMEFKEMKENDTNNQHKILHNDYTALKNDYQLLQQKTIDSCKVTQELLTDLLKEINVLKNENTKLNRYIDVIKLNQNININDEITNLLYPLNLIEYHNIFIDNGFETLDELNDLSKKDLKDMGIIKIAHQNKILNSIKKMCINKQQSNNIPNCNHIFSTTNTNLF